jgi:hypothetical protein
MELEIKAALTGHICIEIPDIQTFFGNLSDLK